MILVMGCSQKCEVVTYETCYVFPKGGIKVADELESIPYQNYEDFWDWVGRLDKLKQELEICKKQ